MHISVAMFNINIIFCKLLYINIIRKPVAHMLICDREIAEWNLRCDMVIQFKRTQLRYVLGKVCDMFVYR